MSDVTAAPPVDRPKDPIPAAVLQAAAEWKARLWADDATEADQAAATEWRSRHLDHERAWVKLQRLEAHFSELPQDVARGALMSQKREPAHGGRRRAVRVLGAGAAGCIAWMAVDRRAWHAVASDFHTAVGETRSVELPDGTRLTLDTGTAVSLTYDGAQRGIVLRAGAIFVNLSATFSTAEPTPFWVRTDMCIVRAETSERAHAPEFGVRQHARATEVSVRSGSVGVQANGEPWRVGAGQRAMLHAGGAPSLAVLTDANLAWTRGRLLAERMRLAEVVAELSRYRPGLLTCSDEVADLLVSGVFSLRDTDQAIVSLAQSLPLQVRQLTRYWTRIGPRTA